MSVAKYEAEFMELAWFTPHMVDTEYKKARKFEGGLGLEVFDRVGVLKLPTYVKVLDKAIMAEATLVTIKQAKAPTTEWKSKRSGFNFKKGRSFAMNKKQNMGSSSNSSQSSGSIPNYPECGRKHRGVCHRASGACYWCGKVGHMIKDCSLGLDNANHPATSLTGSTSVARSNTRTNVRNNTGNETLRQGRAFTLVLGEVQNTEFVVSGTISICAQNAYVLINSGSTHSFVSHASSQKLTRPLESMIYLLFVTTPSGGSMVCAYMYPACDITIGDATLYVDLLPLSLDHFDCILGMDWLTKYCAAIDCVNESIIFRPPGLPKFVFTGNGNDSALKAVKLLRKGCKGYICCVLTEVSNTSNAETIPVACEFSNVFPNDLPGYLIDKKIKFTIEVALGA
ncbi:uncharacterized protein LOC114297849 [Camellia sinensis]|uniref:uncharacterized protein LOC114297849 n=1 Tax=Camellia sinensis TaxID=4442 RepID=UPI001036D9F2|nr:uncharacterized protein LOC114297849 [Camellia sinensis]